MKVILPKFGLIHYKLVINRIVKFCRIDPSKRERERERERKREKAVDGYYLGKHPLLVGDFHLIPHASIFVSAQTNLCLGNAMGGKM